MKRQTNFNFLNPFTILFFTNARKSSYLATAESSVKLKSRGSSHSYKFDAMSAEEEDCSSELLVQTTEVIF